MIFEKKKNETKNMKIKNIIMSLLSSPFFKNDEKVINKRKLNKFTFNVFIFIKEKQSQ